MRQAISFIGAIVCLIGLSAPAQAQLNLNIIIGEPPPALIVEPPPPPRVGFIWAPGFWDWDGHRHIWRGGHWEGERVGQLYAQPRWVQAPGGWRFVPGHWEGHERHEHHHGHDEGFCPPGQAKKGNC